MVIIAEFNKETNQPTGTLYEVSTHEELVNFNRNFEYAKFYAEISGAKLYTVSALTSVVKGMLG